jgi:hypothetical protein
MWATRITESDSETPESPSSSTSLTEGAGAGPIACVGCAVACRACSSRCGCATVACYNLTSKITWLVLRKRSVKVKIRTGDIDPVVTVVRRLPHMPPSVAYEAPNWRLLLPGSSRGYIGPVGTANRKVSLWCPTKSSRALRFTTRTTSLCIARLKYKTRQDKSTASSAASGGRRAWYAKAKVGFASPADKKDDKERRRCPSIGIRQEQGQGVARDLEKSSPLEVSLATRGWT